MLEIACTLRCDGCGEAKAVTVVTKLEFPTRLLAPPSLVVLKDGMPPDWQVKLNKLFCPRCNGAK